MTLIIIVELYDYHLFKDNYSMYQFKKIAVYINKKRRMVKIYSQNYIENNEYYTVAFKVDKQFVISHNMLPMNIIHQIASYYEDNQSKVQN